MIVFGGGNLKKRKRKKGVDKIIITLVFGLMMSLGGVCLLKSDIFNLSKVEIVGNTNLKENQIVDLEKIIINKNIFTYNFKVLKKNILTNPYIEDAQVKMKLPNKIIISIKEVEVIALLSNGQDYCYIDKKGNLIEKINDLDKNSDKIVLDTKYTLGEDNTINFKSDKEKKSILNLLSVLNKEHLKNEIEKIEYTDELKINILTKNGAKFLIIDDENLNYNISRASKILVDLNSKNIKSGVVDLTYGNYAVYKPS